jgi:multidrug resistance efflux pump
LETAHAELEIASLRLAQAKADLEDKTLFAPFDGVIGLSQVDTGDRVTDATLIAILDGRGIYRPDRGRRSDLVAAVDHAGP